MIKLIFFYPDDNGIGMIDDEFLDAVEAPSDMVIIHYEVHPFVFFYYF